MTWVSSTSPFNATSIIYDHYTDIYYILNIQTYLYITGKPFRTNETYNFGSADLMKKTGQYGQTFLKYRLTPPPTEAYSLHRKLAGAILLCVRLRADIKCRDILEETFQKYDFDASE